eukprot:scaffold1924_cov140-Skeletonema_menzelii.AAC.30
MSQDNADSKPRRSDGHDCSTQGQYGAPAPAPPPAPLGGEEQTSEAGLAGTRVHFLDGGVDGGVDVDVDTNATNKKRRRVSYEEDSSNDGCNNDDNNTTTTTSKEEEVRQELSLCREKDEKNNVNNSETTTKQQRGRAPQQQQSSQQLYQHSRFLVDATKKKSQPQPPPQQSLQPALLRPQTRTVVVLRQQKLGIRLEFVVKGNTTTVQAIIQAISPDVPHANLLQAGDVIVGVNGKRFPSSSCASDHRQIVNSVMVNTPRPMTVTFERFQRRYAMSATISVNGNIGKRKGEMFARMKKSHFEHITQLEEKVNELEDNATKQGFINLIGEQRELLSKWSTTKTDLPDEVAEAERQRHAAFVAVFQIERQASENKKQEREEARRLKQQEQEARRLKQQEQKEAQQQEMRLWIGVPLGEKGLKIVTKLHPKIGSEHKKVLKQIENLWPKKDKNSKAELKKLVLSMKRGNLSLKTSYTSRFLRLRLHDEELVYPIGDDVHLKRIKTKIHNIQCRGSTETKVLYGATAICRPRSNEDVAMFMDRIRSKLKVV